MAGRAAKRRKDREGRGGEEGEGKEEEKREEEEKWASRAKTTTVGHVVAFEYASKYTIPYPCHSFVRINYESTNSRIGPVSRPCRDSAYSSLPCFAAYSSVSFAASSCTACAIAIPCRDLAVNSTSLRPYRAYAYSWPAWSTPLRRQRRYRVPPSL